VPIHTLEIPGWHPQRLNVLMTCHWRKRGRLRVADDAMVKVAALNAGIPKATVKRRVKITIVLGKGQRAGDRDAYFKSTLDSLKNAGMIVDDSRQWIDLEPIAFERAAEMATRIELEDLE